MSSFYGDLFNDYQKYAYVIEDNGFNLETRRANIPWLGDFDHQSADGMQSGSKPYRFKAKAYHVTASFWSRSVDLSAPTGTPKPRMCTARLPPSRLWEMRLPRCCGPAGRSPTLGEEFGHSPLTGNRGASIDAQDFRRFQEMAKAV
jgi:hypothetical protein